MRPSQAFAVRGIGPVPVGNLRPEILVVQSAQNWHRQRATDGLDSTRDRRVLLQRKVHRKPRIASIIVITLAPPKTAAKKVSSRAHARPQQKAASRESAVNSGRRDFISALLPSDVR